jgi:hypothetical protein
MQSASVNLTQLKCAGTARGQDVQREAAREDTSFLVGLNTKKPPKVDNVRTAFRKYLKNIKLVFQFLRCSHISCAARGVARWAAESCPDRARQRRSLVQAV